MTFLRRIGRRGCFLLTLGLLSAMYGISIWTQAVSYFDKQYLLLSSTTWGWIWIAAAGIMIWQAFTRIDRIGYAVAVVLTFAWATVALYDWLSIPGDVRGWQTAVLWFGFSVLTGIVANWPEHFPPPEVGAFNGDEE